MAIVILGVSIGYALATKKTPETGGLETIKTDVFGVSDFNGGQENANISIFEPKTITDKLGQITFSQFVKAHETKGISDGTDVVNISNVLFEDLIKDASPQIKVYDQSALIIKRSPQKTDWDNFLGRLVALRNKYSSSFQDFISENGPSVQNLNDPQTIETLVEGGSLYNEIVAELLLIPVPTPAAEGFLDLINAYSKAGFGLSEFKYFPIDPIKVMPGLQAYIESVDEEALAVQSLQSAGLANGIIIPNISFSQQQ